MLSHQCFGIVAENTRGQRFKRLATEIVCTELQKTLQLFQYSKCAKMGFKKLFMNKTYEELQHEHFLVAIGIIQKQFNIIHNAYISGQPLSEILDSIRPISHILEQVDDSITFKNTKDISQVSLPSLRKKVHFANIQLYVENDYLARYCQTKADFETERSDRVELELRKQIEKWKTRVLNEKRCYENISQTYFSDCEIFKLKFDAKNLEYEDELNFYEEENNSKNQLLDKLKNQRKLLGKEIIRFHEEIEKVEQKIALEKRPDPIPVLIESFQPPPEKFAIVKALLKQERKKKKPPKEPELVKFKEVKSLNLESKFENMKNLEKKKFGVKIQQNIKGKQIKKALKMQTD